jgi:hypothetical protein
MAASGTLYGTTHNGGAFGYDFGTTLPLAPPTGTEALNNIAGVTLALRE